MIEAKVIADSVNAYGNRLTTFQISFPRMVLAEFNTHRVFSRNFRSSRAVPVKKLLEEVRTNPCMPVYWGKNQSGMQAAEELTGNERANAERSWRNAAQTAADFAEELAENGLHKQISNRVLEPFLYVHGVVTATEYYNFFGLRLDKAAQPEIRALAEAMWAAYGESVPNKLVNGQWHLPYVNLEGAEDSGTCIEYTNNNGGDWIECLKKISAARCARVSYKSFDTDKPSTIEEDLKLWDKLMGSQPFHASPTEHQATPDIWYDRDYRDEYIWENPELHGNFKGWIQYRKTITGERCAPLPKEFQQQK